MKLLFACISFLYLSNPLPCLSKEPLKSLKRIETLQLLTETQYELTPIEFSGKHIEAYYFRTHSYLRPKDLLNLKSQLTLWDGDTYPSYVHKFAPDYVNNRSKNKIVIVFDNLDLGSHKYHGLIHKKYHDEYQRDIMTLNLDTILKSHPMIATSKFVHELTHLIRSGYRKDEESWLQEGLAKFAEFTFGTLSLSHFIDFKENSHLTLSRYYDPMRNLEYTNNFFFIYYLYSHYGGLPFIRKIMVEKRFRGSENIDRSLKRAYAESRSKSELLEMSDEALKGLHSFSGSLLNYRLGLFLNPYRKYILSYGFLNLKLGRISYGLKNWGVVPEKLNASLGESQIIGVSPYSSRYLNLNSYSSISIPENDLLRSFIFSLGPEYTIEFKEIQSDHPLVNLKQSKTYTLILINLSSEAVQLTLETRLKENKE